MPRGNRGRGVRGGGPVHQRNVARVPGCLVRRHDQGGGDGRAARRGGRGTRHGEIGIDDGHYVRRALPGVLPAVSAARIHVLCVSEGVQQGDSTGVGGPERRHPPPVAPDLLRRVQRPCGSCVPPAPGGLGRRVVRRRLHPGRPHDAVRRSGALRVQPAQRKGWALWAFLVYDGRVDPPQSNGGAAVRGTDGGCKGGAAKPGGPQVCRRCTGPRGRGAQHAGPQPQRGVPGQAASQGAARPSLRRVQARPLLFGADNSRSSRQPVPHQRGMPGRVLSSAARNGRGGRTSRVGPDEALLGVPAPPGPPQGGQPGRGGTGVHPVGGPSGSAVRGVGGSEAPGGVAPSRRAQGSRPASSRHLPVCRRPPPWRVGGRPDGNDPPSPLSRH